MPSLLPPTIPPTVPVAPPGRQTGLNFAELHYTLHRHYDPVLMRFTGPDPIASPFYNLHHYTGNSPARFFDPDGLFELELFSIGDTKIGISTEGYGKRLKETAVGAAVGGWDAVTLGMHLDDDDKRGIAESYGVDASSGYFAAGMIAGNMTVSVAFGVASGGLAGATCVGRAASVARVVGNVMKGAMAAGEAVEVGGAALEYADTGEWSMRQTMALVGLAGNVGGYALGKVFHPKCFVAGTQVLAMDETGAAAAVAIETIEAGDLVWSRCEQTGEEGFKVVVETYLRETDELVHLSYTTARGTDTLIGTAEHPFWSLTSNGWVDMGKLKVGERLRLSSGTATVTALRTETLAEPVKVYNFQVADWHTYYAAPEADKPFVWVHNANYSGTQKPPNTAAWELRGPNGKIKTRGHEVSGGTKPGRRLSFPEQQKLHTEGKIMAKIDDATKPGDILTIRGREAPCPMCRPAMRQFAHAKGIRVEYTDATGAKFVAGGG